MLVAGYLNVRLCAGFSDALALLEADARCLPASEKRQGTKSREAGQVLYGDLTVATVMVALG